MNIIEILTNNQFKRILNLYKNIEKRIKSDDCSLTQVNDFIRLKEKTYINRSSEESILLAFFPIMIFVSYIILVIVLYDFYFSSDQAGFIRSANMFIISVVSLLALYAYRGNISALKTLNALNTLSIVFALSILLLDYFVYYMHHEWYLLIIVFFNFFTNRVIINSASFSQAMTEILWFKTTNQLLRKQIDSESDGYDEHTDYQKKNIFTMLWQYCILNTNLNNTLKESYALNLRVKRNDATLLSEKRINKYQHLLEFGMSKKTSLMTLLATVLLIKAYVIGTFILLSHFNNKNDLPILFFLVVVALMFSSLPILLTHRGITLGFNLLSLARYLFIIIFILLVGLKFVAGMLEYSNLSLAMIALEFLLVFFMLNTEYYCRHLRELHCFLAWHKVIRNNYQ
ncbi:hypothetical protein; putative membrane protein [Xenorhabdus nematophila ATCC 19061]|uniref:Uncharacterized protein n=1 Tax=Xenorhabdus nematophila (strain ATCC 19061 / DSM 3370 / CCUG 14189 / LMG 1036 / NCIMB 9965 / AN6) TaxID=406817 RepID=D3VEY7_XENNA|nr:hypothetical protein [Xenorhabdus nematophila]CBJ92444.1 hypothetical protein; putative membrane protein [Xenorhabdus nematophila ATCC 19061]CEK25264.1 hypothetical protein; putative membrane protein [Xenorhabdus nematophila AN6/1]